ncbi:MAG TPA: BrxA/BrxB family bacilliredoxin [Planctomycetes bacterium]|nr:BrxA/BrxB family bacilliredoxin [Planctomycetota bacterium]
MLYDPVLVQPMRDEVTRLGAQELHTPEEVDAALKEPGTTLVFVNSVCGCAAAGARPGLALALAGSKKPDRVVTIFAGMEREAVARAREYFKPYQPSSPQIALMKDGEVLKMWQRHDIEGRDPSTVAQSLGAAFEEFC